MTNHIEDITKIIQRAGIDGTLTNEAVKQYNSLLTEKDELKIENERQNKILLNKNEELSKLKAAFNEAEDECKGWRDRLSELQEREKFITTLELLAKYEATRVLDHQEMFKLIFRNTTVRKEVMTPLRGSEGVDQYGTQMAGGYASKDIIEEEDL